MSINVIQLKKRHIACLIALLTAACMFFSGCNEIREYYGHEEESPYTDEILQNYEKFIQFNPHNTGDTFIINKNICSLNIRTNK